MKISNWRWLGLVGLVLGGVVLGLIGIKKRQSASKRTERELGPRPSLSLSEISLSRAEIERLVKEFLAQNQYPAEFEIVKKERVDWPTGALGCPKPGKVYTQSVEPGYRLLVKVKSETLELHLSIRSRRLVQCQ